MLSVSSVSLETVSLYRWLYWDPCCVGLLQVCVSSGFLSLSGNGSTTSHSVAYKWSLSILISQLTLSLPTPNATPPTPLTGTFSTFWTPLSHFTPAADSYGRVSHLAFVLDEWTWSLQFPEVLILPWSPPESHNRCKDSSFAVCQIELGR